MKQIQITVVLLLAFVGIVAVPSGCGRQKAEAKQQLLEVYDVHGSAAKARLTIDGKEIFTTNAFVGQNGLGKEREGDRKTPLGELHIKGAFGLLPNPGTTMPYIDVTPSTFSCSDHWEYYNHVIDTAQLHHQCDGEDMFHIAPEYNYGLITSYNEECIHGLGNSIFVHAKGDSPYTGGCIALDEERMVDLLTLCDTTLIVRITP